MFELRITGLFKIAGHICCNKLKYFISTIILKSVVPKKKKKRIIVAQLKSICPMAFFVELYVK